MSLLKKFKELHSEKLDSFQDSTFIIFEQGMSSMDVFGLVVTLHVVCVWHILDE